MNLINIEYENLGKLNAPFFDEMQQAFSETLRSGWYILGKQVELFEQQFADFCGTQHCVGVANGLDALELCIRALNLPSDSEILVPSNTYIATILSILQAGFKPVLVEPDSETYNMDPQQLRKAINSKTRAVLVVHLYGKLCNMEAIMPIAQESGLKVIEDCAQAHGASFLGKRAGSWGDVSAWSFYPTKNLGALGDAGAITTNDSILEDRIRMMRNYGSKIKYNNEIIGRNSRLDELQAAFLRVKLKHLDEITKHKQKLAGIYHSELKGSDYILPVIQAGFVDVFHIYNIRHPRRDELRQFLLNKGIKTDIHYPTPPHKQKAMKGILSGTYPIAEQIHETTLSLPISYFHTEEDVRVVCKTLRGFL